MISKVLPFIAGRQGTGYLVTPVVDRPDFEQIINDALSYLAVTDKEKMDAYLLKYPDGSYIASHLDTSSMFGKRHIRLNCLVKKATSGGELIVREERIDLEVGDAYIFHPDEMEHQVTPVVGERLIFTVGALI
jgi:Rps23 Pro-64 3,4-dihydroxylase Tpa1-like proline 4-hydroxylase